MTACSYNFIKFSMCSYNFNVAVRISINLGKRHPFFPCYLSILQYVIEVLDIKNSGRYSKKEEKE